jgi:hypothetical protein
LTRSRNASGTPPDVESAERVSAEYAKLEREEEVSICRRVYGAGKCSEKQ